MDLEDPTAQKGMSNRYEDVLLYFFAKPNPTFEDPPFGHWMRYCPFSANTMSTLSVSEVPA
jgi:hypothetical protein